MCADYNLVYMYTCAALSSHSGILDRGETEIGIGIGIGDRRGDGHVHLLLGTGMTLGQNPHPTGHHDDAQRTMIDLEKEAYHIKRNILQVLYSWCGVHYYCVYRINVVSIFHTCCVIVFITVLTTTIWMGHLAKSVIKEQIAEACSGHGRVHSVDVSLYFTYHYV